ncbi:hypothetical protein [Pantanalinema sp. GBBB05]|uniref:hypothetical protein n=1 Tax=Pantanalinema sp. GBBB05 TaxID=2604139 RepID=UPI001D97008E|nr:hypothetical protein [Pantanalinema sp. GBBB05]
MVLQTRGSSALSKAQRRLALLKSLDINLDLGSGLTVAAYTNLIEENRATLEAYNTLLSNAEEYRQRLNQMDAALSAMSERMLTGVAAKYGRTSVEYTKAGGSARKRKRSTGSTVPAAEPPQRTSTNGFYTEAKQPVTTN